MLKLNSSQAVAFFIKEDTMKFAECNPSRSPAQFPHPNRCSSALFVVNRYNVHMLEELIFELRLELRVIRIFHPLGCYELSCFAGFANEHYVDCK